MREDVFDIASYATKQGLHTVISPNGTLITAETVRKMAQAGIKRVSVSIDGSSPAQHDAIRGVAGAFDGAMRGIEHLRQGGQPFQVNTTIMRQNVDDLNALHNLVVSSGAVAWHIFMLVPTGRGSIDDELTAQGYEAMLNQIYDTALDSPIPLRVTCGPQFMRLMLTREQESDTPPNIVGRERGLDRMSRGCLAGMGYCFISHRGDVYPCGYLPTVAGNIRDVPFRTIYQKSSLFRRLRDLSQLEGKCGACSFVHRCGGCRARAYALTGNYLAEEPYCAYEPESSKTSSSL